MGYYTELCHAVIVYQYQYFETLSKGRTLVDDIPIVFVGFFFNRMICGLGANPLEFVVLGPIKNGIITAKTSMPNRRSAITRTNDDPVHWRIEPYPDLCWVN